MKKASFIDYVAGIILGLMLFQTGSALANHFGNPLQATTTEVAEVGSP